MSSYIFISTEGYTYQPGSESIKPDIENCQVIGFSEGIDDNNAFKNLICDNPALFDTTFDELICIELKNSDYHKHMSYFNLKQLTRTLLEKNA
jgi:hypothetical protein